MGFFPHQPPIYHPYPLQVLYVPYIAFFCFVLSSNFFFTQSNLLLNITTVQNLETFCQSD